MTGLKLIAVLVIVGGAIAFVGDRIGMRVGRRRLTLWGLRPRHTSVIITILTGIFIAAGSITVLSLSSNDVRTALFHLQQIQTELKDRTQALSGLKDQVDKAQSDLKAAQSQVAQVKAEYEKTKNENDLAQARVANLQGVEAHLTQQVDKMTSTVAELKQEITNLQQQITTLQQQAQNGDWIFRKGDLLAAAAIQAGTDKATINNALIELAGKVEPIAKDRGAAGSDGSDAVQVDNLSFESVEQNLLQGQGTWVVRVVAAQNSLAGQPVPVAFVAFADQVLYEAGDVVDKTTYRSDQDPQSVVLSLLIDTKNKMIEDGMLTTGGSSLPGSAISGDNLFNVLDQLRKANGPVTVEVVATQRITRVNGLHVELKVVTQ